MRHLNSGRKLHIDGSQRKAMFRNMVTSLMIHGKIRTTEPRAKELRRIADRVITLGKRIPPSSLLMLTGDDLAKAQAQRVHAIRLAKRWLNDREAIDKVFNVYSERYKERQGGYTQLFKIGVRPGDNAPMNVVMLIDSDATDTGLGETADAPAAEPVAAENAEAAV